MVTLRLLIFVFLISAFCFVALAQNQKNDSQTVKLADAFLVEKNKPSVYITYEKSGKAEPIYEGESNERVWARLHNNTKGEISFCHFKVKPPYGDVGLYYDVRRNLPHIGVLEEKVPEVKIPNRDNSKQTAAPDNKEVETPSGYSSGDTCVIYYLASGKSVLFSIPREHLVNKSATFDIKMKFSFEWEEEGSEIASHPQHIVYFSYGNLYWGEIKQVKNQK